MSRADQDSFGRCRSRIHTSEWAVCASAVVSAPARPTWRRILGRRAAPVLAAVLVLLGVIAVAVRLDAPGDGTVVSFWQVDGVIIDAPDPADNRDLHSGDLVTVIAGHRLADGLGGLPAPVPGDQLIYDIVRNAAPLQVPVRVDRVDPYPLLLDGWGNLIFVVALAALAGALYVRRPGEPATTPLLINAAALFGSTLAHEAGLPALALATGGPQVWLYNLNIIGSYTIAWGAALAFALELTREARWRTPLPRC